MVVGILDSDKEHRAYCKRILVSLAEKHQINIEIKEFSTSDALLCDRNWMTIDVICVNVMLKKENGCNIGMLLREDGYSGQIVFYSKQNNYIFEAFSADATQYLIEEMTTEQRFEETFFRVLKKFNGQNENLLVLKNKDGILKVSLTEVYYFEVKNRIITMTYKGGTFDFYSTLENVEETLTDKGFIRCHRSYVVASDAIVKVNVKEPRSLQLINGDVIGLGRKYVDRFI